MDGTLAASAGPGSVAIACSGGAIERQACNHAAVVLAVAPPSLALRNKKSLYVSSGIKAKFEAAESDSQPACIACSR